MNEELSNIVLKSYPTPIALAWRHFLRSINKKEEHDSLLEIIEISAMYLATALISQYRFGNKQDEIIEQELQKIPISSFGTFNFLTQKIPATFADQFIPQSVLHFSFLLQKKETSPEVQKFIKEVSRIIGKDGDIPPQKITLSIFLDWCVTYRNEIAHAKPAPSEEVCRERVKWIEPAVAYFIEKIKITSEHNYVYLQRALVDKQAVIGEVIQFSGWDIENKPKQFPISKDIKPGSLYICDQGTNELSLRSLPIFIYGKCPSCTHEPRVFIFRKADITEKRPQSCKSIDYTCPVCGNRWTVDEPGKTAEFMEILVGNNKKDEEPPRSDLTPDLAELPTLVEAHEPQTTSPLIETKTSASSNELLRRINRYIGQFMSLQSQKDNSGTRGLDPFGKDTYIETLLDTKLKEKVLSGTVNLVVLTGNAGDGKTAFIQQVEEEARQKGAENIEQTKYGTKFTLGGRQFQTIYDGSEDEAGKDNRKRLEEFFSDFCGHAPDPKNKIKIIAINEGHLRNFLFSSEDHDWLREQTLQFLERENFALDPSLLIINLNLRSVVDNSFTTEESILDRQLKKFLAPKYWEDCTDCSAMSKCPIKFNVDTLSDPENGRQARSRLKALYLISHLRSRQHITIRDLRASLAYILVNRFDCESIHLGLENDQYEQYVYRYYYNSAFGGEPEEHAFDHEQERVIGMLKDIDVAPVPNPHLDNLLGFTPPSMIGLFAEFKARAPSDMGLFEREFTSLNSNSEIERSQSYHSILRRKIFFEGIESATIEAGYSSWLDMLPFTSLKEFMSAMKGDDALKTARENIIDAINTSEKLYDSKIISDNICIRTNTNPRSFIKAFNQIPKIEFVCRVKNGGRPFPYLEHCPNTLIFRYDDDPNKTLELNLDLYELLVKIKNGSVPGGKELKDFFLNLILFKKQLTALPSRSIVLTEDETHYYRLSKIDKQMLKIERIG